MVVFHVSVQFPHHLIWQRLSLPTFYIFVLFVVGEGNGKPLQYSCLGNHLIRGAWQATVCVVTKESDTTEQLNNSNLLFGSRPLESFLREADLKTGEAAPSFSFQGAKHKANYILMYILVYFLLLSFSSHPSVPHWCPHVCSLCLYSILQIRSSVSFF